MRFAAASFLALLPMLATAAAPSPRLSDKLLNEGISLGEEIEARADGDLNRDGLIDTAYAVGSPDARSVEILFGVPGPRPRWRPGGTLKLDTSPIGRPQLSIAGGVLKVDYLSGGTTAIKATYRYRFDPQTRKLRLIGLDATLYSRTFAHDGYEISWNLLTGAVITRDMLLSERGGDAAYGRIIEHKLTRTSGKLFMETTPDPELVMVELRGKR